MGQMKQQKQCQEQLPFSEQLRQSIINQPCDLAAMWGRAADSFPENKRKQRTRTTIAVVVGVVICALAMHFLSSPERWIRLYFVTLPKITTHYEYCRTYQPLCVVCDDHL